MKYFIPRTRCISTHIKTTEDTKIYIDLITRIAFEQFSTISVYTRYI